MTPVSTERLKEILAGCECVDDGPWKVEESGFGFRIFAPDGHTIGFIMAQAGDDDNAQHIARLDPQTVSSLLALRASPTDGELVERAKAAIKLGDMTGSRGARPENIYNVASDLLSALSTQGKRLAELEAESAARGREAFTLRNEVDHYKRSANSWRKLHDKMEERAEAAESALSTAEARGLERAAKIAEADVDWTRFARAKKPDALTGEEQNIYAIDPEEDMTPSQANVAAYRLGVAAGRAIAAAIRAEARALSTNEAGK